MAAQKNSPSRSSNSSGGSLGLIIPLVLIISVLGGGGYYFFFRSTESVPSAPSVGETNSIAPVSGEATEASSSTLTPNSVVPIDQLTVEQLLKEASNAFREGRREAPAGKNALEYYIKALEKDPQNRTAKNALLEIFPLATDSVGKVINNGQLDEANRLIDLLAKSDPNNYTLTILRSKLQAKKKQMDREEAQAAALAAATPAPRTTPSPDTTPVTSPTRPEPNSQTPATGSGSATVSAGNTATSTPNSAPPKPAATTPTTVPTSTASAPTTTPTPAVSPSQTSTGETHEVQVVRTTPPEYPRDAVRKRQQGWVEVAFTVTADGQVADVQVMNSDPPKVFDREAIRAVQRWTFKPKMQNGVAVPGRVQRRLEFKLDG